MTTMWDISSLCIILHTRGLKINIMIILNVYLEIQLMNHYFSLCLLLSHALFILT